MKKIKALSLGVLLSLGAEMNVWGSDDSTFPDEQYAQAMEKLSDGDTSELNAFFGDPMTNSVVTNPKYFNLSLKFAQNATPEEYLGALSDLSRVRYVDLDASAAVASKIENIISDPREKKRLLYKFLKNVAAKKQSEGLLNAIQGSVDTAPPVLRPEKLTQLIDVGFFDMSSTEGEDGFVGVGYGAPWPAPLPALAVPPIHAFAAAGQGYGGGGYGGYAASAPFMHPSSPYAVSAPLPPYHASYTGMAGGDDIDSVDISDIDGLLAAYGAIGDDEIVGNLKFLRSNGFNLQSEVFDNISDIDSLRETVSTLVALVAETLAGS